MDQFARQPAFVMLTRLDDQDRPAKCREGSGSRAARNAATSNDNVNLHRHAAWPSRAASDGASDAIRVGTDAIVDDG